MRSKCVDDGLLLYRKPIARMALSQPLIPTQLATCPVIGGSDGHEAGPLPMLHTAWHEVRRNDECKPSILRTFIKACRPPSECTTVASFIFLLKRN